MFQYLSPDLNKLSTYRNATQCVACDEMNTEVWMSFFGTCVNGK